jgi:sensor histidine kinase regulating citrate/malate metabolism
MLANFKKHAKEQITKKQKAIETLTTQKQQHEEKIQRIIERIHDKKIKGMISDESDESEEEGFDPKTIEDKTVTIEEF